MTQQKGKKQKDYLNFSGESYLGVLSCWVVQLQDLILSMEINFLKQGYPQSITIPKEVN